MFHALRHRIGEALYCRVMNSSSWGTLLSFFLSHWLHRCWHRFRLLNRAEWRMIASTLCDCCPISLYLLICQNAQRIKPLISQAGILVMGIGDCDIQSHSPPSAHCVILTQTQLAQHHPLHPWSLSFTPLFPQASTIELWNNSPNGSCLCLCPPSHATELSFCFRGFLALNSGLALSQRQCSLWVSGS